MDIDNLRKMNMIKAIRSLTVAIPSHVNVLVANMANSGGRTRYVRVHGNAAKDKLRSLLSSFNGVNSVNRALSRFRQPYSYKFRNTQFCFPKREIERDMFQEY